MNNQHNSAGIAHDDLEGLEAREKIRHLIDHTPNCFFVTRTSYPGSTNARPMAVQDLDSEGNLWFISSSDTHKDRELQNNPEVYLYFQSSTSTGGEFLEVLGRASISHDQQRIEQLWKPEFNAWFEMGKEDPKVSVIKVTPHEGHYWDTEHGGVAAGVRSILNSFFLQKPEHSASEGHLRP